MMEVMTMHHPMSDLPTTPPPARINTSAFTVPLRNYNMTPASPFRFSDDCPATPRGAPKGAARKSDSTATEAVSGRVWIIRDGRPVRLRCSVYRGTYQHYAVLLPDSYDVSSARALGYISLRNCHVQQHPGGSFVGAPKEAGTVLVVSNEACDSRPFVLALPRDADSCLWINALQPVVKMTGKFCRSPVLARGDGETLPVLEESDESGNEC